jgi:hypothetical protein
MESLILLAGVIERGWLNIPLLKNQFTQHDFVFALEDEQGGGRPGRSWFGQFFFVMCGGGGRSIFTGPI